MTTNTQIQSGFYALVENAVTTTPAINYPLAWPGGTGMEADGTPVNGFTPPDSGYWFEVSFAPNANLDDGLANDSFRIPRGLFQITVAMRPGSGQIGLSGVADEVISEFPKGTVISDPVRVIRHPYQSDVIEMDDRLMIPVTIEYSG